MIEDPKHIDPKFFSRMSIREFKNFLKNKKLKAPEIKELETKPDVTESDPLPSSTPLSSDSALGLNLSPEQLAILQEYKAKKIRKGG
jgi:hypothetical protein